MNEVEKYISGFPPDVQERMMVIRSIIYEEVPQATERICMNVPTFDLDGKSFAHFGGFAKHIGFYPQPQAIEAFSDRLAEYKTSKGTVRFPHNKPLPSDLIREMIRYKLALRGEGA